MFNKHKTRTTYTRNRIYTYSYTSRYNVYSTYICIYYIYVIKRYKCLLEKVL